MWTQFHGHTILPRVASWAGRPGAARVLLPLRPLGAHAYSVWRLPLRRAWACRGLHVIGPEGTDRLCARCRKALLCAVEGAPLTGVEVTPGWRLGWSEDDLRALRATREIPYLAAIPPHQWDELAIERVAFGFGFHRLLAGLRRLRDADFEELVEHPDMCRFIHRRVRADRPGLREQLLQQLDALSRWLNGFASPTAFNEAVRSLAV
jgi:hypothetical protein